MAQFVGEHFDGIINGVTAFGIFVELDNGVEGLVRVSSMEDDYYQYVEEQYSLIGERSHKIYRLGDSVKVILVRVSPEERNIDFVLESNSAWIERAANRRPSGGRPQSYGAKSQASDTSGNSKKVASAGKNRGSKAKKAVVTRVKPKSKRNKPKKK